MNRRDRRRRTRQTRTVASPPVTPAERMLQSAIGAHRAGRLDEAEALYGRILETDPDHAEALHLRGIIAHQAGRGDEALRLLRRAVACRDGVARYHNSLGLALRDRGRPDEAEACYRRALALDPGHVETLSNLAGLLAERGLLDEAVGSLRRALALRPGYAPGHNNLGNVLKDRGDFAAAEACYRRALELEPGYAEAHYNLGVVLTTLGRLEEAETSCRRALALDADDAAAHNNLGNILRFQGRLDEAIASYRRALTLRPDFASAHNNLAAFKTFSEGDAEFAVLEALKHRDRLASHEAICLHFALGKMYDDVDDVDRAFANYREGNVLRQREAARTGRAFDAAAHDRKVERLMAAYVREQFEQYAGRGDEDDLPLFIVGMPRSGTSLVEQILASHPAVFGAGELPDIGLIADRLQAETGSDAPYPKCLADLDTAVLRRLGEGYVDGLRARAGDALRVSDKMPANVLNLGLIALLLPRARIIHCRRDPRDVCVSCYFHDFFQGNEFANDLGDLGAYYRSYRRLMSHWRDVLPLAIFDVRYEDLVADQEGVSRRLVAFCGLDWDARCLDFHKTRRPVRTSSTLQVRRKIFSGSVGRWRAYQRHLTPLVEALGDAISGP